MAIIIKKVSSKKELKTFIRFNYELYKGNPYSVPDLYDDMLGTFSPKRNAAFEFCEADYFLAYNNNKVVGRVAAIINKRANETWNKKEVRFGWIDFIDDIEVIDFIDDIEVSEALLDTVARWGKERGMEAMVGPLGFTDMDAEGMLIEGFDQLSTMSTIYNFPYYPQHLEKLGFEKEADWVEFKLTVPDKLPEKFVRISEIILQKYKLRIKKLKRKEIKTKNYGQKIFDLINEAYAPLNFDAFTFRSIAKSRRKDAAFRLVSFVESAFLQKTESARLIACGCEARISKQGSQCLIVLRFGSRLPANGI